MIFLGESGERAGCFTVSNFDVTESKGATIAFEGGESNTGGGASLIPATKRDGLLVVGINMSESESVSRMTCFKDKIYTYAFGAKPGNIQVRIIAFLGHSVSNESTEEVGPGDTLKRMLQLYRDNRISASLKQVSVSFPGEGVTLSGELDGMTTGTKDPNSGIQDITLNLTTTAVQGTL